MAMACIDALGRDVQQAADALTGVVVPGRMERVDAGQDFMAVVDYAHKPAALAAVLDAIRDGLSGRLIVVVGAGGDRDTGKRPVMGAEAAMPRRPADRHRRQPPVRGPGRDPRAGAGRRPRGRRGRARSARSATGGRRSGRRSRPPATGDAVVIAGKGHELGQEIAGVVHPFSDRDELHGGAGGGGAGHRADNRAPLGRLACST